MTDPSDPPVNMSKSGTAPAASVPRPPTALVVALLIIVSGLAAIGAGFALMGQGAYIERSLTTNNPPVTAAQQSTAVTKVQQAVDSALDGTSVGSGTAGSVGDKAANVLGDTDVLPAKNVVSADRKQQQSNVRDAVNSQLKGVSGTVSSAQAATIASSVAGTVRRDLATLHSTQLKRISDARTSYPRSYLIQGLVVTVALVFVAYGVYVGRYWARWAVPIIWVLCTFTRLPPGLFSLTAAGSDAPVAYKGVTVLSSLALLVALVLTFMRPTRAWFDVHRPVLPPGRPARQGGLFGPRMPPPTGGSARTGAGEPDVVSPSDASTAARGDADAGSRRPTGNSPRAKRRTTTETAAEATEPATASRNRPRQASKSRRTEG